MSLLRRGVISSGKLGAGGVEYAANTANLNGTTQYFNAGNPAVLQITGSMSASCWVKFDTVSTTTQVIFSKYMSVSGRSWTLQYTSVGETFQLQIDDNGSAPSAVTLTSFKPLVGVWYNIAFVYDGSDVFLYVDGIEEDNVSYSGGIYNSSSNVVVGAYSDGTIPLDGSVAFPSIWDSDLSSSQIEEVYNSGTPVCPNDLSTSLKTNLVYAPRLSNWDTNAGQELTDQSTSGITTTNIGSTPFTGTGLNVEC